MSVRLRLLSSLVALSLLAGCSRGTPPPSASSEPGTPSAAEPAATPAGEAAANEPGTTATQPPANLPQGPTLLLVRTSGVRCITEPCPYYLATRADRPDEEPLQVHELDLGAVAATDQAREELERATFEGQGLKVEAVVEVRPNAGPAGAATVVRVRKVVP